MSANATGMAAGPFAPDAYRAPWWLKNRHLHTIYAALRGRLQARPVLRRERWDAPDGDFVDVDFLDGPAEAPLVVLFHGLEGSSASHYAGALAREVAACGWRFALPHFRGCSGEPNRLPRAYHSGDSDEIDWLLQRFSALPGEGGVFAAGVSLGGNALLKWLGEPGRERGRVQAAAAVSAPLDLQLSGDGLALGFNRIYTRMFLSTMKARSEDKLSRHPGIFDAQAMRVSRTLREFDNVVTAPLHGFRDTDDYWSRASSLPLLQHITLPTLIINALDDPFVPVGALPDPALLPDCITAEFPAEGGHVAFVSGGFPGHLHWMPRRLLRHFQAVARTHHA
jgi:predicted alpha/beta-fold hydrolase